MTMKFACKAATQGNARCRNLLDQPNSFCSHHEKMRTDGKTVRQSDQPDCVLYKFNVNKNWSEKLKGMGVKLKPFDWEKREQKHIDHARRHGREPFRFRGEICDSGVPVFGEDGLKNVSVFEILKELAQIYVIVDIHLRPKMIKGTKPPKEDKHMEILVVSFSDAQDGEAENNTDAFQELMDFLASSRWGHCHVWANPPADDGRVIHTVNTAHRQQDERPERKLEFREGQWGVEELAQAAA